MKRILIWMMLSAICFISRSGNTSNYETAQVIWVFDGDTIKVQHGGREHIVRILGIDCPESKYNDKCKRDAAQGRHPCRWQVPRGRRATKKATRLLQNQSVTLECGKSCKTDYYDRKLRYVRLKGGLDYGLHMVKEGYCEDFSWKYPHPRQSAYRTAQNQAKQQRKGIWNN